MDLEPTELTRYELMRWGETNARLVERLTTDFRAVQAALETQRARAERAERERDDLAQAVIDHARNQGG